MYGGPGSDEEKHRPAELQCIRAGGLRFLEGVVAFGRSDAIRPRSTSWPSERLSALWECIGTVQAVVHERVRAVPRESGRAVASGAADDRPYRAADANEMLQVCTFPSDALRARGRA